MNVHGPQQTKVNCLPTYILIDTSSSMKPVEDILNDTIEYLYDELTMAPAIAEFVRLSLVTFNTDAHVVLAMTDIQDVQALPQLECGGSPTSPAPSRSYASASTRM
jgi:uncharacterized protein YegL